MAALATAIARRREKLCALYKPMSEEEQHYFRAPPPHPRFTLTDMPSNAAWLASLAGLPDCPAGTTWLLAGLAGQVGWLGWRGWLDCELGWLDWLPGSASGLAGLLGWMPDVVGGGNLAHSLLAFATATSCRRKKLYL